MVSKATTNTLRRILSFLQDNPRSNYSTIKNDCFFDNRLSDGLVFLVSNRLVNVDNIRGVDCYSLSNHSLMSLKGDKQDVWVLVQKLDRKKRVRLEDGSLTPTFEFPAQAFNYADANNIVNCDVIKV